MSISVDIGSNKAALDAPIELNCMPQTLVDGAIMGICVMFQLLTHQVQLS